MIDLHTHTDRSDGSASPADLVRLACDTGLRVLAIADHDTLAGFDAAAGVAAEQDLELICAVELSTRPAERYIEGRRQPSIHVLGYWLFEPPTPGFRKFLENQQASRTKRNLDLVRKLQRLGLAITLQEVAVHGRNQIGRPHFARVLCDKGYVASRQEAFDIYLADEGKAAVDRDEPTIEEGIQQIREAGGLASLAHPVRLPQRATELHDFVERLVEIGLEGIEIFHSEHSPTDTAEFTAIADRLDLIPTGGSDFHGENKPEILLGRGIGGNVALSYEFLERMRTILGAKRKNEPNATARFG